MGAEDLVVGSRTGPGSGFERSAARDDDDFGNAWMLSGSCAMESRGRRRFCSLLVSFYSEIGRQSCLPRGRQKCHGRGRQNCLRLA